MIQDAQGSMSPPPQSLPPAKPADMIRRTATGELPVAEVVRLRTELSRVRLRATPPETKSLIIALGAASNLTYVAAEVGHHTPLTLVGCRFTGRV